VTAGSDDRVRTPVDELIEQINTESEARRSTRRSRARRAVTARRVLSVSAVVAVVAVTWPFAPVLAAILAAFGLLAGLAAIIFRAPASTDGHLPEHPSSAPPPVVGGPVTGSSPNALWPAGGPDHRR
jgi:hypothetical protein